MIATEFEFDGISSSVFGLYICSFNGAKNGTSTLGNEITFNAVKSPRNNKWIFTDRVYENPLTFTFQCFKYDCNTGSEPIVARELSRIIRWLVRNDGYHYLRFKQNGWDNVFYHAQLKVQKYEIAGQIYGFEIEAICDAPWGYSEMKEYKFEYSDDVYSFNLYNFSDEDGKLLPELVKIEILEDCNLAITNSFNLKGDENNKYTFTTSINNCKSGEVIYLDKNRNITSNINHVTLSDDFDYNFLCLFSDFFNEKNTITISNPCNITINWREIREGDC
mgnify:CR=1 FL=1